MGDVVKSTRFIFQKLRFIVIRYMSQSRSLMKRSLQFCHLEFDMEANSYGLIAHFRVLRGGEVKITK